MRTINRLVIVSIIAAMGCGPKVVGSPPEGPAGLREKSMDNCPSAVAGAATSMRSVEDGLALDVTAADAAAIAEIKVRAARHAAMGEPSTVAEVHSGHHGGPGDSGHCPVLHLGTRVNVEEILGGARITVIALDPATADALRRDTRERLRWFEPVAGR